MITPEEIAHPSNLPKNFTLIDKVINPSKSHRDFLFLKHQSLLIIFVGRNWTNKLTERKEYLSYQACFPMEALSWVVKMLNHFFTSPKDGGSPVGKIATADIIAGEKLQFDRGICVGGPDHGGYTLTNLSCIDYGEDSESKSFQEFDFPDPWLFDGGLLEFWEDLAERYERGEI